MPRLSLHEAGYTKGDSIILLPWHKAATTKNKSYDLTNNFLKLTAQEFITVSIIKFQYIRGVQVNVKVIG